MTQNPSSFTENAQVISLAALRQALGELHESEAPTICPDCGHVQGNRASVEADHQRVLDRLLSPTVTGRVNAWVYRFQLDKLAWILTPGVEKVLCPDCTAKLVVEEQPTEPPLEVAA